MEGDLDRGEREFLRALEIYRGLEQPDKIAMVLNNLGNLYRMRDQHTKDEGGPARFRVGTECDR